MMRKALLMALLLVPGVLASDSQWQEQERDVSMRQVPGGIVATSTSPEDRIDIAFDTSSAKITYVFSADGTRLQLEQRVAALVEWEDRDGDGQYSLGDRTVHRTPLDGTTATASVRQSAAGQHAVVHYTVLGQTTDGPLGSTNTSPGRFTIAFDVLSETVQQDGRAVTPTEIPIALRVEDFPYRDEGTELALEVHVATDTVLDRVASHPIVVARDNHTTFYQWQSARLDGQRVDARATEMVTSPEAPSKTVVYFALARGDGEQPTTIGTTRDLARIPDILLPRTAGDVVLFTLGALTMASIVGVPAWRRMRSK